MMKTDREVSEESYLNFVAENVLPWEEEGKEKLTKLIDGIRGSLERFSLPFPDQVYLIRTTGNEAGGAAYTRANAIVLPRKLLSEPPEKLRDLLVHELFHILTRTNPELREKLFAIIGFEHCGEVPLPPELAARSIANPDAPTNAHCIRLKVQGRDCWAVPLIFSDSDRYDLIRGGEFFNYLQFRFLLVERAEEPGGVRVFYDGDSPRLVEVGAVKGFWDQVGFNTSYIIHPEEILADNFVLMVLGNPKIRSPEIPQKMGELLRRKQVPEIPH